MNLIVAVAIILLNLYVAYGISRQIPHAVLSICFPDVSTSICVEADLKAPHECKHSPYRLMRLPSIVFVVVNNMIFQLILLPKAVYWHGTTFYALYLD